MRDVIVFAIVFGALPFAFVRPFYGLLLFSWLAYMRAPDLTWGPAKSFRFSMIVAAAMYAGWFLMDKRPFMRRDSRSWMMIGMAIAVVLSYLFAPVKGDVNNSKIFEFVKVILIALFTTGQLDSKSRIRTLVWVIALSLGFYGIKGGIWGILLQDARIIRGPGGLLLDNNDFSLAMVMNLPFLWYLSISEENRRVKNFLRAAVFLTVITIVITMSRGGFLAMTAVFGAIVLKSKYKALALPGALVGALLFFALIPSDYRERIASIRTASKEDGSAIGRLRAWGVAWEMIKAHPVLGVGFNNFVNAYDTYDPGFEDSMARVAHNSYLQIWAESGTFAFLCFVSAIVSTIFLMRRLQRIARVRDGPRWMSAYAALIECSLYGFLVGAMFLNRAHFDFLYHLLAIASALYVVSLAELREAAQPGSGTGRRRTGKLVVRARDPFLAPGAAS